MEGMTNKTVTKPDQQLEPLHALGTNEGIRDFPGTVEDIGTMGGKYRGVFEACYCAY